MKSAVFTALFMIVPWVGLSWLGWHNSRQMRAVFPGREGRLFLAILMATLPWFMGPAIVRIAMEGAEATGLTGAALFGATTVGLVLLGGVMVAALWSSRRLIMLYMRLRGVQSSGGDLKQAAIDAAGETAR